jgi:hypothetical protein
MLNMLLLVLKGVSEVLCTCDYEQWVQVFVALPVLRT